MTAFIANPPSRVAVDPPPRGEKQGEVADGEVVVVWGMALLAQLLLQLVMVERILPRNPPAVA